MKKKNRSPLLYHNYLFLFGFVYYMILPFVIVISGKVTDIVGMDLLEGYNVERFYGKYIICSLAIFLSFFAGSKIGSRARGTKKMRQLEEKNPTLKQIDVIMFLLFLFVLFYSLTHREYLFQGYLIETDGSITGIIATGQLIFLFWLIFELVTYRSASHLLALSVIVCSIMLIGMGSRMYVLIPCISILLYVIEYQVVSFKKIVLTFAIAIFAFVSVGLLRQGNSITADGLLFIGLAEPCFTWISAESLFQYTNEFDILSFPENYFTSFYNFVPSLIFPNKAELIKPISLPFDAPVGATNLLVSLISNFGLLGSCLFIGLLGWFLSFIRMTKSNSFWITYYLCVCSIIPFQLFRDELVIVNKVVFMNLLIFPWLIRFILCTIFRRRRIRNKLGSSANEPTLERIPSPERRQICVDS